jgi:hypothetical protein
MAQSPEYPDLKWVQPRSWTDANRTSVQFITIHTTEGSAHSQSAEDGAAYDARRTDGTSAHYFVDNTSVIQCVRTNDRAHTARTQGNRRGIHYELCARAGWAASRWADSYSEAMLKRAAKQAARDARKWGIPIRHLTVDQVKDGVKGFCSHWDITRAFPADGGTHTDPGPNFPWSRFLDMVRAEISPPSPPKENPVAISLDAETREAIAKSVWDYKLEDPYDEASPKRKVSAGSWLRYAEGQRDRISREIKALMADLPEDSSGAIQSRLQEILDAVHAIGTPPVTPTQP